MKRQSSMIRNFPHSSGTPGSKALVTIQNPSVSEQLQDLFIKDTEKYGNKNAPAYDHDLHRQGL